MDCSPPGSSVHGTRWARILEWVAMPSSWASSPIQGSNPGLPHCRWILHCLSHQGGPKTEQRAFCGCKMHVGFLINLYGMIRTSVGGKICSILESMMSGVCPVTFPPVMKGCCSTQVFPWAPRQAPEREHWLGPSHLRWPRLQTSGSQTLGFQV